MPVAQIIHELRKWAYGNANLKERRAILNAASELENSYLDIEDPNHEDY